MEKLKVNFLLYYVFRDFKFDLNNQKQKYWILNYFLKNYKLKCCCDVLF